jgi:hypothetical protein
MKGNVRKNTPFPPFDPLTISGSMEVTWGDGLTIAHGASNSSPGRRHSIKGTDLQHISAKINASWIPVHSANDVDDVS